MRNLRLFTVGAAARSLKVLSGDASLATVHDVSCASPRHFAVELRANIKSISHRYHLFEVAFVRELTTETINLPLGCLQGGVVAVKLLLLRSAGLYHVDLVALSLSLSLSHTHTHTITLSHTN